ncbi:hypothetical protein ANCCEY_11975 [Ancylostoma ceylanicum]|uniref:Mitochondrial pyruvate carrier n=1 Tax=Ancylostoma ceylanicum TaxID=53326 RepID=A0A0D6LGA1_9BILA|nr:hypothetical protein ANCCEY_11975 [Ancylostoma ceylanicum]
MGDRLVYPILPPFAKPLWNHPAGPKTVFFWGPTIKWGLVIAGLADLARPANKLSVYQWFHDEETLEIAIIRQYSTAN